MANFPEQCLLNNKHIYFQERQMGSLNRKAKLIAIYACFPFLIKLTDTDFSLILFMGLLLYCYSQI